MQSELLVGCFVGDGWRNLIHQKLELPVGPFKTFFSEILYGGEF